MNSSKPIPIPTNSKTTHFPRKKTITPQEDKKEGVLGNPPQVYRCASAYIGGSPATNDNPFMRRLMAQINLLTKKSPSEFGGFYGSGSDS